MDGRSICRRLGAAVVAVVLMFAPHAGVVVHAVEICTQYECYPVTISL